MTLAEQINALVERQLTTWKLAHDNFAALDGLLTRELWIGDGQKSRIILQHNPARIRSTAADVRPEAIKSRPCFLCNENQPIEQESVLWESTKWCEIYKIQVNPYPIFKRHLTISRIEHGPQRFYYQDMMELAQLLPEHVILFNGKGCGASAPDHMHFQATLQDELPLCAELEARKDDGINSYLCYRSNNELWMDGRSGRQLIYARAKIIDSAVFKAMKMALPGWSLNALCWHKDGIWHFVCFPRTKGRPSCYGVGPGQFLLSPAAAEYGGVWVLPRKEDFDNLTADIISSIYQELSCSSDEMEWISYDFMLIKR